MAIRTPLQLLLLAIFLPSFISSAFAQQGQGSMTSKGWYEAHGWLMWAGFTVFLPLGILIARLGRHGTRRWVLLHILTQVTGAVLIIAGAIIALAKFNVFSEDGWSGAGLHPQLGIFIVGFLLLQPLLAIIRPRLGSGLRVPWYIVHLTIGLGVVGLAWYNIFLGINIYKQMWGIRRYLVILLACQISIFLWLYLLLNRWEHMQYQRRPKDIMIQNGAAQSEGYGVGSYESVGRDGVHARPVPAGSAADGVPPTGAQYRV